MLLLFVTPPNGLLTWLLGNWPLLNGFWFSTPVNCWAPPKGFMLLEMSEKELPNFAGLFWACNPKAWPEFLKSGACFGCLPFCGCNESIWLCCCDCCCGCGNSISSNSDGVSSSINTLWKQSDNINIKASYLLTKVNRSGADKDSLKDLVMVEIKKNYLKIYVCSNLGIHCLQKHWVSEDCLEQARVKLGEAFRE